MTRSAFYRLVIMLMLLGYAWLAWAYRHSDGDSLCLFCQFTGLPCPACGSTRALLALWQGNVGQALTLNPLGLVLALMLVGVPVWWVADALCRRDTLYRCFLQIDALLHRRAVFLTFVFVIVANWIWNISKAL